MQNLILITSGWLHGQFVVLLLIFRTALSNEVDLDSFYVQHLSDQVWFDVSCSPVETVLQRCKCSLLHLILHSKPPR